MTASSKFERLTSVVLTISVVIATAILVEQRLSSTSVRRDTSSRVEFIETWQSDMARAAVGVDLLDSGVQIAVFTDYQCPFCRRLDSVLNVLSQQHRGKLSRSVIHFPLSEHPHARRAAQAMECASVQGRGREVHGQLYANQNRIGDLASSQLAAAAAIPDSDGFAACVAADSTFSRIDAGLALGDRLKVSGTPVALVNGWLLDPATPSSVAAAVEALINGKTPKKKGV